MKDLVCLDIEVLPNYFLIAFKGLESGKVLKIDMFGESSKLSLEQRKRINSILTKYTSFGFNSQKYDMPLINYAMEGASSKELHEASKDIIDKNQPDWLTYRNLGITPRDYDHFDICEPSPAVMISLKNYGTRVGSKKLQEFYLDPHKHIGENDVDGLRSYCENDLDVTIDLYNSIKDRIGLRVKMSEQYGIDLRSKSDAQIAETVITSELEKRGVNVNKPELSSTYKARYKAPDYIHFENKELQKLVKILEDIHFSIGSNGALLMPKVLANHKIVIGKTTYKMGIGGLHSQEKSMSVVSNEKHVMRNADFTSYYPTIILNLELFPKHLSRKFLGVYGKIREERLFAKAKVEELKKELKNVLSQKG